MDEIILPDILTFEWDEGNISKSWVKHKVSLKEQEQAFFDKHKRAFKDSDHSQKEERFTALGVTDAGRRLHIILTIRKEGLRIISARNQSRKERRLYAKKET